jgi:hypothetical protein
MQTDFGPALWASIEWTTECSGAQPIIVLAKQQQEPVPAICWITVAKISAYRINEPFIPLSYSKTTKQSSQLPGRFQPAVLPLPLVADRKVNQNEEDQQIQSEPIRLPVHAGILRAPMQPSARD